MNNARTLLILLCLFVSASPLWAKKHHLPAPTETPLDTPTETPTTTPTPIPYNGPKLYTFDAQWGSKGSNPDQLNFPEGIDISPKGNMVIADTGNSRIVIWDENGKPITTIGSFGTQADWKNTPQFNHPGAVYVNPASRKLYVSDTLNHRIVVVDDKGVVVSTWGSQGSGNGQFNLPRTIATDHFGNLWVLDSGNSRVEIFSGLGQFNSAWGMFADPSANTYTAIMNLPLGMALNHTDQALVADTGNFRFQVFNNGGVPVTAQGWYGEGPDQFKEPGGVAITKKSGIIAITDGTTGRVEFFNHRFDFIGQWTAKDDILNSNYHPRFRGIACDDQDRLYLTDLQNGAIVRIKPIVLPNAESSPTPVPPTPTPTPPDNDPYGGQGFPIR